MALVASSAVLAASNGADRDCTVRPISRTQLVAAMRDSTGYDIAVTTNAPRLGADVFIRLARAAIEDGATEDLILIRQDDWFRAFLEVTELTVEEAPAGARLAWEYEQDMYIDYHSDRVVVAVEQGPEPDLALAVRIEWPPGGGPDHYSYQDTLAVPEVRVTSQRVVEYRLLVFEDMVVYDAMEGLSGRPTTGLLGVIFAVLGDAQITQSRIGVAEDQWHVVRARAKKGFISSTSVASFDPNGIGDKGVPPDRPDLRRLREVLERPLQVRYRPFPCLRRA